MNGWLIERIGGFLCVPQALPNVFCGVNNEAESYSINFHSPRTCLFSSAHYIRYVKIHGDR